jgi:hypothetical protein
MKIVTHNGLEYRLPSVLNPFQEALYIHLINWKWKHITREPGKSRATPYDAILPVEYAIQYPILYPGIVEAFLRHREKFPFRLHSHFNHMASSQAANLNLFLPVLLHSHANAVLSALKPDFARLATEHLDHGYRIEYWDEPFGNLGDKNKSTGTDSDLAIAYYNPQDELCLWLIEHKLTESEFTPCGGFKSKGRQPRHDCSKSFVEILDNPHLCYYHDAKQYKYWELTQTHREFFSHLRGAPCPFQGGLNQLWRNQLLALSIENDPRQPYQHITFSVVKHPRNTALDNSLARYREMIGDTSAFSTFTSADVITAAVALHDPELDRWIDWYRELYAV